MKSSQIALKTAQTILKSCVKATPFLLAAPLSLTSFNEIRVIAFESNSVEAIAMASPSLDDDHSTAVSMASVGLPSLEESLILFNAPDDYPRRGNPKGRAAGGTGRGKCGAYEGLMALTPVMDGMVWGQTTTDQPTLWFYSPAALTPDQTVALVVQDKSDNYLYQTTLELDMEPGLISIQLPNENADAVKGSTTVLPVAEPYHWTFFIECDPDRIGASVSVSGTFQKIDIEGLAPLADDIDVSNVEHAIALAQAYAASGVWHDALTILGELQRTHPSNPKVSATLAALLSQGGLTDLASID
ncbi:MAG: DUF928 domain-containing protein [Cyanobacteria bacterium P01_F01_bin.150]